MFRTDFVCRSCGQTAGSLATLDSGEVCPAEFHPGPLDDPSHQRVVVVGPGWTSFRSLDAYAPRLPAAEFEAAIRNRDALMLFKIDDELVSFWCPRCDAAYCRTHWNTETVFDEGFYDCTYGTCPRGHRRMLDD